MIDHALLASAVILRLRDVKVLTFAAEMRQWHQFWIIVQGGLGQRYDVVENLAFAAYGVFHCPEHSVGLIVDRHLHIFRPYLVLALRVDLQLAHDTLQEIYFPSGHIFVDQQIAYYPMLHLNLEGLSGHGKFEIFQRLRWDPGSPTVRKFLMHASISRLGDHCVQGVRRCRLNDERAFHQNPRRFLSQLAQIRQSPTVHMEMIFISRFPRVIMIGQSRSDCRKG